MKTLLLLLIIINQVGMYLNTIGRVVKSSNFPPHPSSGKRIPEHLKLKRNPLFLGDFNIIFFFLFPINTKWLYHLTATF